MSTTERALRLYCAVALKTTMERTVIPAFSDSSGISVDPVFAPTRSLLERVTDDDAPDVFLGIVESLTPLQGSVLSDKPLVPLARTGVGVAVPPGSAAPRLETVDELKQVLLSARSVAYSEKGPSGVYFAGLLERLGIASEVNDRAAVIPEAFTALALTDGRSDVAIQQMSELKAVPGVTIAGPLPEEVQKYTSFAAGIGIRPSDSAAADAFVEFIRSETARAAYAEAGLEAL